MTKNNTLISFFKKNYNMKNTNTAALNNSSIITKEEEELRSSDPDLELEGRGNNEELLEKMSINSNSNKAAVCPYSTGSINDTPSALFVPLNINRNSHQYSEDTISFMDDGITLNDLQNMTELFYDKAFQDVTLDKFLRSKDDPHGSRFAKWIYTKLTGSNVWDNDCYQRRKEHNVITLANNHMIVVHDRSSAHVAAWNSIKRPSNEVGRHFKLDECRVWMRLHFWSLRDSGLIEKSPTFANYYIRFIGHFVRVYENNAPIFARDSFRWSLSKENIKQYINNGRKMKDVLGLSLNESLSQIPLEEVDDLEWPYNRTATD
jgi:hypothetical protein